MTYETFTLDHPDNSNMGKWLISLFKAANRRTRAKQFQLARALGEKGGPQYDPRDTRAIFDLRLLDCRVDFTDSYVPKGV